MTVAPAWSRMGQVARLRRDFDTQDLKEAKALLDELG